MSAPNVPSGSWVPGGSQQPGRHPQPPHGHAQQGGPQHAAPPPQGGPQYPYGQLQPGPAGPPPTLPQSGQAPAGQTPPGQPAGQAPPGQPPYPGAQPGGPPPGAFAPRPYQRPVRDWKRTWVVAAILGLIGLLGGGSATYAMATATGDSGYGPVKCGDGTPFRCLRGVQADAVVKTWKDRGFTCKADRSAGLSYTCELTLGSTTYETRLTQRGDMVEDLFVAVNHNPALELSTQSTGFLLWSALLPFADDPAAEDVTRKWLTQQLAGTGEAEVKIRGYPYKFAEVEGRRVELEMEGGYVD